MTEAKNVRQRKKQSTNKKTQKKNVTSKEKTSNKGNDNGIGIGNGKESNDASDDGPTGAETLKQVFLKHPLIRVAPFVLIPYFIYNSIFFLTLQRPDIINGLTFGLANFRQSMGQNDERQILIIGAEFQENRFVSGGMSQPLKLEIVHEAFDAKNYFCRDGSVSLFQIMRFLDPLRTNNKNEKKVPASRIEAMKELCIDRSAGFYNLFHPKYYYDATNCSSYDNWSPCWTERCLFLVHSIWGCEWSDGEESICPHQFARIIHQVRHPIHTIDTLNVTMCSKENVENSFRRLVMGWFPARKWQDLSCFEVVAWYTVDFHSTMLKARDKGLVHGMFQVERRSPCEVAMQGNFLDISTTLFPPNVDKLNKICYNDNDDDNDNKNNDAQSAGTFTKVKEKNGMKLDGVGRLSVQSLSSHTRNSRLISEVTKLIDTLGYGKTQDDSEFSM